MDNKRYIGWLRLKNSDIPYYVEIEKEDIETNNGLLQVLRRKKTGERIQMYINANEITTFEIAETTASQINQSETETEE